MLLPINGLLSFNGLVHNKALQLNWQLDADALYQKLPLRKAIQSRFLYCFRTCG